jgi:hypothetical protein
MRTKVKTTRSYISPYDAEVESDLPDDIRDDALRVFRAAVDSKCTIKVTTSSKVVFDELIFHIQALIAQSTYFTVRGQSYFSRLPKY